MKYAFAIFRYFPFGGLQRDMLRIALALAEREETEEVRIFVGAWEGPEPESPRVRVVCLKRAWTAWSNAARARDFERKFKIAAAQEHFDLTVAFNRIGGGCDWYFAADECLACSMREKHARWVLSLPRYRSFLNQERRIFSPASRTKIFHLTEKQKLAFQQTYHTGPARFTLLPPGIDRAFIPATSERRAALRRRFGVSDSTRVVVLVGANLELKGADRAVEALNRLPVECADTELWLIGARPGARGLPNEESRVRFWGMRNDLPEILQAADLMLHPARQEAAGNVIAEALACGVPVLCTAKCGFAPLAEECGCPVIPEPFEQACCTEMLAGALRNLDFLRRKVAENATRMDWYARPAYAAACLEADARLKKALPAT